jgi:hypothetical protein
MSWFWRVVFWWKKKTGWLDLGKTASIMGTVVGLTPPDIDGDQNFDVRLDDGLERWITGFGGRLTTAQESLGPSIHCEIPPWAPRELRKLFDQLKVGDRVYVSGAWGFDGVHTPGMSEWWEILRAIVRHPPNVQDGWFEIHPVNELDVLSEVAHPRARPPVPPRAK